jgi:hypothetical protein
MVFPMQRQSNWPVDTNIKGDTSTGAANQRKETEIGVYSTLDGPVEANCPTQLRFKGGVRHINMRCHALQHNWKHLWLMLLLM